MKMRVIIFLTLTFTKIISCDDSNESKYIDLLPEEEKEQFLQKIARRIFEETEVTDDRDKQSREVTDDQLNQHTEFVENILREESENLRKNTKNEGEEDRKSEESVKVKPLENDKIKKDRIGDVEDRYIDLTLRQGSRKKRKDNFEGDAEEKTEGQINVDIKYDREENKVIENGETSSHIATDEQHINSNEAIKGDEKTDQSSIEDIQVKTFISKKHGTSTNSNEVISSTNKPRITQIADFEAESAEFNSTNSNEVISSTNKPRITQIAEFEAESPEFNSTEFITSIKPEEETESTKPTFPMESLIAKKNVTSSERSTESVYKEITRSSEEPQSFPENVTTISTEQTVAVQTISPTNRTKTQLTNNTKRGFKTISQEDTNLNLGDHENDLNQITEKTNPYSSDYMTTISTILTENTELLNDSKVMASSFFTTSLGYDEPTTIKIKNTNYTTLIMTNTSEPNSSIVSNESTTNIPQIQNNNSKENSETIKSNTKNMNFDIGASTIKHRVTKKNSATNEETGDVVKTLRQRLLGDGDELDSYSENVQKKSAVYKGQKSYKVYELPPNKEPFALKHGAQSSRNQEQPYYVPIYNYSADNAYFNPQNRYGPNSEDSFEKKDSDMDVSRYQKEEDTASSKESYDTLRHRVENSKLRFNKRWSPKHYHKAPNKIIPIVNQNDHFSQIINPNDYLDMDYYFGRTNTNLRDGRPGDNKKLPDLSDEINPSVDGFKNHIRLVRKILFGKKILGYIPPVNGSTIGPPEEETRVNIRQTVAPPFKHLKRNGGKNIEVDYYYGRLTQVPQLEIYNKGTKVGYVKDNNFIRDLHLTKNINEALMRKVNVIKFNNKLFFREDIAFNDVLKPLRERITIYSSNNTPDYIDTIQKVMKLTNVEDMIPVIEKMRSMNISYTRSGYMTEAISAYLEVLNDMLKSDTKPLTQYDWLETTVEIQSAISKLMEMTEQVQSGVYIHGADLGLLKYAVYLFQTAKINLIFESEEHEKDNLRMSDLLPKNKKRKKSFLKEKGLINRVWLFKRQSLIEGEVLDDFKEFLFDLRAGLYDLHNAIKHIAMITKFNNQAWFQNLQRIYMNDEKKHLLEVILHLSANRLFGLIEDSAENGVEINLVNYMKNNELEVGKSVDECVFVLRLLDEIKNLKN